MPSTLNKVLGRLQHVRTTGSGWRARCPAHDGRRPSLSIREGERGLLLHCFSGCPLDAICAALGITPTDLFSDKPSPRGTRRAPGRRPLTPREFLTAVESGLWRGAIAHELRGLAVLDRARGLNTSAWTDTDVDRAMRAVCRGYNDLGVADHLHGLVFAFRERLIKEESHA